MFNSNGREVISYGFIIMAITLGLYFCSLYSYLLFHSLVEITTIAIGFTLFILAWNTRKFLANDCLKFVGVGYAFIAVIDLLHTLAYRGMNVFPGYSANLPTQLWIAARFLQALTLCAAPVFARRRVRERFLFGVYFAAVSMISLLVFSGNFPDCYVEGMGLTPFKIIGEYTISAMLVVSLILFRRVRSSFNDRVYVLIVSSLVLTAISELFFTEYLSVYGFANMLGHLMKLSAFYLIYRALLVTGLKEPFDLIFRDLTQKKEALRNAHASLEEKVVERTAELRASEEKYRALIECANDAVFIHEITEDEMPGPFIEVNELACRLLGYGREEFGRMSPTELDDPRYRYRIALAMARLLQEGQAVFETAQIAKDGRSIPVEVSTRLLEMGGKRLLFSLVRDITERKRAEEERRANLMFFESMDRVNRAIQGTDNLERIMSDVLDVVLSILGCDRAYLVYPCDPEAETWTSPMERTTTAYPGVMELGIQLPMDDEVAETFRILLSSNGPVKFGPGGFPLPADVSGRFQFKSFMSMALYPKVGKPWQFGIHQCSHDRVWTSEEERLLKEIGRRLQDALTGLLMFRDLRESEERYRRIVDTATEGIWMIGPDMLTTFVNRGMTEMLGCSGEEIVGRSLTDFLFEEDIPGYLRKMENRRRGVSEFYECRFRRQDGRKVWTQVSATPIFDAEHHFNGSFAMFTDITDRKRMEDVLRESEELFRSLTEKSLVGVYIIQDDLFRYVNPAFAEIFGYQAEDIIDKLGPVNVVTPEDRERVLDSIRRRTVGEIEFSHHGFNVIRKDGSIRSVEAYGARALHQGRPAILGTLIDVTERRKSEEKLYQVTQRWERTFDAVPDLIAIIDTGFRIVQANKAMADRLGVTPAECAGQVCYEVIHKAGAPPSFCPHVLTLQDCREHTAEVSVERLGGDFIVSTSPVYDSAGELIGSVHVARDITERRKAEEERKLLESQLHQSQKMEAIGQLAGGIAHDFNNMLTAIMGYAEIILRRIEKDSPLRHFVEQVLTVTDSAAELTKGLLSFSRRRVLHAKPMDLCGVVLSLEKMLKRLLPEDVDFRTKVAEGNLIVMADRGQIEQVLVNLVNNARDAMPKGGSLAIEVSRAVMNERFVHAHGFGEPAEYACLAVTDSGQGMDEETRKRIFEPFFTTKEVGKGTGLGMAIVYGIIQQHDGCITVGSETGKGTTFRLFLPLINEEISETHWVGETERPPGGTETVLLVEDEVTVRESYKMILEEAGYRVVEAVDGEDALDRFMEHSAEADMVVTDVIMPKIDGKALCDAIGKTRPDIKVMFMSGYTKEILAERGILVEESNFMTKPVKPYELLTKVREILDRD